MTSCVCVVNVFVSNTIQPGGHDSVTWNVSSCSKMTSVYITSLARRLKSDIQCDQAAVEWVRPEDVDSACRKARHRWRDCFWTPCVIVRTFIRQVLHGNCSCREAVELTLMK